MYKSNWAWAGDINIETSSVIQREDIDQQIHWKISDDKREPSTPYTVSTSSPALPQLYIQSISALHHSTFASPTVRTSQPSAVSLGTTPEKQ